MKKYDPLVQSSVEALEQRLKKSSSNFAEFETAEIGYGVRESNRSKGFAVSALRLVSRRAFSQSPLRKLIAFVHADNLSSIKVLEKVDFKREGLLREHYLVMVSLRTS